MLFLKKLEAHTNCCNRRRKKKERKGKKRKEKERKRKEERKRKAFAKAVIYSAAVRWMMKRNPKSAIFVQTLAKKEKSEENLFVVSTNLKQ